MRSPVLGSVVDDAGKFGFYLVGGIGHGQLLAAVALYVGALAAALIKRTGSSKN